MKFRRGKMQGTIPSLLACGLLAALLGLLPHEACGQAALSVIFTNGPASNRLNIVVMSEAYNASDLAAKFPDDASNAVNNLFAYEPYTEYQSYFNAYAVAVASAMSGSTHLDTGIYGGNGLRRTTYFNSSYDSNYDYILTIPPNAADSNYADGQGKVDALVQSLLPQCGLPMMVVNDDPAGGSGGPICIASSFAVDYEQEITVHESGHTLGKLGDEYDYAYTDLAAPTNSQPNTTQTTNLSGIKWDDWISAGTPIPTPTNGQYSGAVGLFQGANYQSTGWYRPQEDCMMRTLGSPFCSVCSETLIKAIYQKARPIDAFNPATNSLSLTSAQPMLFSVTTLQPATHNLTVQWSINSSAIGGATNRTFSFQPALFANGSYTLTAQAHDPTPLVRNDPSNLLTASVNWILNLNLAPAAPAMTIVGLKVGTNIQLIVQQPTTNGYSFVPESNTNLLSTNWSALAVQSNSFANGTNRIWCALPPESNVFFRIHAR